MHNWLPQQWYRRTLWSLLLWPFSLLFRVVVLARRLLYRIGLLKTVCLSVPVIVVGNISVGGAGKTPFVIWLVEFLREQGFTPGVVSRGYGGASLAPHSVSSATDPALAGDEPVLLARRLRCPVWVGADKAAVARALLRARPDCNVIVSDDGLQHYHLARDVEIAVVDGQRRHGNGLLLPAGPLREPVSRLQNVHAVVVNAGDARPGEFGMALQPGRFCSLENPKRRVAAGEFSGGRLHALAGIGNPERFFQTLRQMGLQFTAHPFPDHHAYQPQDLQFGAEATILMTEKDAVKCLGFAPPDSWYLEVSAQVDEALKSRLLELLKNINHGRKTA